MKTHSASVLKVVPHLGAVVYNEGYFIVADTSTLLHEEKRGIDALLNKIKTLDNPPFLTVPQLVYKELEERLQIRGADRCLEMICALEKNRSGTIIPIDEISQHDEALRYEIKVVLPRLGILTSKSILRGCFLRSQKEFLTSLTTIIDVHAQQQMACRESSEEVIERVNLLLTLYDSYSLSDVPKLEGSLKRKVEPFAYLKEIIRGNYRRDILQRINDFNTSQLGCSISFELLRDERLPHDHKWYTFYEELRADYQSFWRKMIKGVLTEGIKSKEKGVSRAEIQEQIVMHILQQTQQPSVTDIHVASAYAYPLEKLFLNMHQRKPHIFQGRAICARDHDIQELAALRIFYTKGKISVCTDL